MKKKMSVMSGLIRFLLPVASVIVLGTTAKADSLSEEKARMQREAEERRQGMKQREAESRARIEAGRRQGEQDLNDVADWIRAGRTALDFSTRSAKAWVEKSGKDIPAAIREQGKHYRTRFLAVEKSFRDCGTMLHSSGYVVSQVLRKIAETRTEAESVAREGNGFCIAILNLHAGDGKERLQVIDEDLKTAYESLTQARDAIQRITLKELETAKNREARHLAEADSSPPAKVRATKRRGSEAAEWKAERKATEAQWKAREAREEAELAKRELERRAVELEDTYRNLLQKRESCGKNLATAVDPSGSSGRWGRGSSGPDVSDWEAAERAVRSALESVEALAAGVAAFGTAVSDFRNGLMRPDVEGATDGTSGAGNEESGSEKKKADPRKDSSRTIYSWSPWSESNGLSESQQ